jgi:hypothetical protein
MSDLRFESLFDGISLAGWHAVPREFGTLFPGGPTMREVWPTMPSDYEAEAAAHPAKWTVEEGALVGRQAPAGSGYGGYLVTDDTFGDFELSLEMKPDWPADTGVMIRRRPDTWHGFQVLVDHRKSGTIGQFFGNGLGSFHAVSFNVDVARGADGEPIGLVEDDPATTIEPITEAKRAALEYGATAAEFLEAWQFGDWNELRIRCVGRIPRITTWINGVPIGQLDASRPLAPDYDPEAVADLLGPRGHIAIEVHDNDPAMGEARWGVGAACRWRNIRIAEVTAA